MERHRHNLPEWLVREPLKAQLGDEFWPWPKHGAERAAGLLRQRFEAEKTG